MATITATRVAKPSGNAQFDRVQLFKWSNMTTNDVGEPVFACNHSDRTIAAYGTFGGATVTAQGYMGDPASSSDLANANFWLTLVDQSDNNIAITSAKAESIAQLTVAIRPAVTGGTGTAVDVYLLVKE